jgi:hypothetical protein
VNTPLFVVQRFLQEYGRAYTYWKAWVLNDHTRGLGRCKGSKLPAYLCTQSRATFCLKYLFERLLRVQRVGNGGGAGKRRRQLPTVEILGSEEKEGRYRLVEDHTRDAHTEAVVRHALEALNLDMCLELRDLLCDGEGLRAWCTDCVPEYI